MFHLWGTYIKRKRAMKEKEEELNYCWHYSVSQFKTYLDISAGDEVIAKLGRVHNLSKKLCF
jgi:hypothetical protein